MEFGSRRYWNKKRAGGGFLNTSLGLSPEQIDSKKPTKLVLHSLPLLFCFFFGPKNAPTLYSPCLAHDGRLRRWRSIDCSLFSTVVTVVAMLAGAD